MMSFIEALELIKSNAASPELLTIRTADSLGAHVASPIYAPIPLPPFDNSAVDGFVVCAHQVSSGKSMRVFDTIRAVGQNFYSLNSEGCFKIMTGAPIPMNADAVIMKEDAYAEGSFVSFSKAPRVGDHIRKCGEDIKPGELVAVAGQRVTPQLLGVCLGLGIAKISIFKMPTLAIICTGDELVKAGQKLEHGEVYFLVGDMLKAQAQALGIHDVSVVLVGDSDHEIEEHLRQACCADLVLITGGMSKGDHDRVRPALKRVGVREIFYQGYWRPGKPLYFGCLGDTCFFGLPGNPVASFVAFRIFVQAWLGTVLKCNDYEELKYAQNMNDFSKVHNFAFFARAQVDQKNRLKIIAGQGSHEIFSLSRANALCYIPAGIDILKAGSEVGYWAI